MSADKEIRKRVRAVDQIGYDTIHKSVLNMQHETQALGELMYLEGMNGTLYVDQRMLDKAGMAANVAMIKMMIVEE